MNKTRFLKAIVNELLCPGAKVTHLFKTCDRLTPMIWIFLELTIDGNPTEFGFLYDTSKGIFIHCVPDEYQEAGLGRLFAELLRQTDLLNTVTWENYP